MPKIILEVTDICLSTLGAQLPKSTLFVIFKLPFVSSFSFIFQHPITMLQTVGEGPFVIVAISIIDLSLSIWPVFGKHSHISISISVSFSAESMLHEVNELPLISIPRFVNKDSKAFNFPFFPLSNVRVSF